MIEFVDKTSEKSGTPVNREKLMALQGFEAVDITVNEDGSITETNRNGDTLTTKLDDNLLTGTQVFVGEKTIQKSVRVENGKIEVIIE